MCFEQKRIMDKEIGMTDKKDPIESKIKRFKRGSALDKQIGGSHYKSKKIGGIDRERYEKIKHYCELALELKCGSH